MRRANGILFIVVLKIQINTASNMCHYLPRKSPYAFATRLLNCAEPRPTRIASFWMSYMNSARIVCHLTKPRLDILDEAKPSLASSWYEDQMESLGQYAEIRTFVEEGPKLCPVAWLRLCSLLWGFAKQPKSRPSGEDLRSKISCAVIWQPT